MLLALVLLVLLGISVLANLKPLVLSLVSLGSSPAPRGGSPLYEVLVEDNQSSAKIAIVDVQGLIYGGYVGSGESSAVNLIHQQLKRARSDPRVRAVILRVNSPGGEVLAADEMARAIAEFQEQTDKPVVAVLEGVAASGGYYVAAPCRWIVANELTLTGSIGVIMQGYNYRGLLDKVGVRPQVFKSGRFKDMLRGSKSPDEFLPEEEQMVQALIEETFGRFKTVIAEGRAAADRRNDGKGRKLDEEWQQWADGRIFSGKQAFEAGFVDELGSLKTAVSRAKDLANTANANLIRYQPPRGLADLLGLVGEAAEGRSIKVDLGLRWPPLEVGRPYFLYAPGMP
jgi:protease-4